MIVDVDKFVRAINLLPCLNSSAVTTNQSLIVILLASLWMNQRAMVIVRWLNSYFEGYCYWADKSTKFCPEFAYDIVINLGRGATR